MSASLATTGSRLLQADRRQVAINKIKSLCFITKKVVRSKVYELRDYNNKIRLIGEDINCLNAKPTTIDRRSSSAKAAGDGSAMSCLFRDHSRDLVSSKKKEPPQCGGS